MKKNTKQKFLQFVQKDLVKFVSPVVEGTLIVWNAPIL